MTILVTDTCSVINFAAVNEMAVLKEGLADRARCTQAVDAELRRWATQYPALKPLLDEGWLGEPIELNQPEDEMGVGALRTFLGGPKDKPTLHLGEAESIHAIRSRPELANAVLLTDDRDARSLARNRGVQSWDTIRLMADLHGRGELEWAAAQSILTRMMQAGRPVRIPASYTDFANG